MVKIIEIPLLLKRYNFKSYKCLAMNHNKVISTENFGALCRICLISCESLLAINTNISEMFQNITDIIIDSSDNLPQNICKHCDAELTSINSFIKKCKNNHSILMGIVSKDYKESFGDSVEGNNNDSYENISSSDDESIVFIKSIDPEEKQNTDKHICNICNKILSTAANLRRHINTFHWELQFDEIEEKKRWHKNDSKSNLPETQVKNEDDTLKGETEIYKVSTEQECKICKKLVQRKDFITHVKEHLPKRKIDTRKSGSRKSKSKKKYICLICNKDLKKKYNLDAHLLTHTGERPFKCKICNNGFVSNTILKMHLRRHTGEKPYLCHYCAESFPTNAVLNKHLDAHKDLNKFKCDHCGREFYQESELEKHLYTSHFTQYTRKNMECTICKKSCTNPSRYKAHVDSHSEGKKNVCTYCGKCFITKEVLKVHTRKHTGETPYGCNYCDKEFAASGRLLEHVRRHHTGEKPFICKFCNKCYFDASSLNKHIKRNHPNEIFFP